jgi:hypothetical protein
MSLSFLSGDDHSVPLSVIGDAHDMPQTYRPAQWGRRCTYRKGARLVDFVLTRMDIQASNGDCRRAFEMGFVKVCRRDIDAAQPEGGSLHSEERD